MFACLECGHKFKTTRAAERAMNGNGCPKCHGSDIDLDRAPATAPERHRAKIERENARMPDPIRAMMNA
jgi:predicted  nucleic acid-binding Zn-ribbon protein